MTTLSAVTDSADEARGEDKGGDVSDRDPQQSTGGDEDSACGGTDQASDVLHLSVRRVSCDQLLLRDQRRQQRHLRRLRERRQTTRRSDHRDHHPQLGVVAHHEQRDQDHAQQHVHHDDDPPPIPPVDKHPRHRAHHDLR